MRPGALSASQGASFVFEELIFMTPADDGVATVGGILNKLWQ